MGTPMIGHRSADYAILHGSVVEKLKKTLFTKNDIFLGTCSATGMIEAAIRNCVGKKILSLGNGAFSDKWHSVAEACGKQSENFKYEWGQAIKPVDVDAKLATGEFDAVFITHSETSTGVLSNLKEIAEVVKKYPNVFLLVDAVSSFAGTEIRVDEWGIDVIAFGTQKALALPPGLAIAGVSPRALERSANMINKGYYFDFQEFKKSAEKNNTPTTPNISLIYALDAKLNELLEEGMENRWARHTEMSRITQKWAKKRGLEMFSEASYHAPTVSTIKNTHNWDIGAINKSLTEKHDCIIANGYKKLKDLTFRIGHMGDWTPKDIKKLLKWIDEAVGQ